MAISYLTDATAKSGNTSATASIPDFTLTVPASKTDLVALVAIATLASTPTSISVSVGGTAGSLVSGAEADDGFNSRTKLYAVVLGNTSGDKTVAISWSGNTAMYAVVALFDGVDQTDPTNDGQATSSQYSSTTTHNHTGGGTGVITVASYCGSKTPSSPNKTDIATGYQDGGNYTKYGVQYASGDTNPSFTWSISSDFYGVASCDLAASSAAATSILPHAQHYYQMLRG